MKQTTLALMIEDGKIFLGEKKRGFAKGVLNGVGGKIEGAESIEECMIREAKEEIGINIETKYMDYIGVLHFYFEDNENWNQDVHLFKINKYSGDIIESEEIRPFWFDLDKIPYNKMWEDDIYWLPRILAGEKFVEYDFWFDTDNGKMIKYKLIK